MIVIKILVWFWVVASFVLALMIEEPRHMIKLFEKKSRLLRQILEGKGENLRQCKKVYIDVKFTFSLYNLKQVDRKAKEQHPKTKKEFLVATAELLVVAIGEYQTKTRDASQFIFPGKERVRLRELLVATRELEKEIQAL